MVENRTLEIVEILRARVLRGLQSGTLAVGERLPSARELVAEFGVDHRLILAAYRRLADDGLVEVRERGGVYVAPTPAANPAGPTLPLRWFVDALTDAYVHAMPAPQLHEWVRRSVETLRLRVVVVSTTADQVAGLARELRDDFGLDAEGIVADQLSREDRPPIAIRRADLLVSTSGPSDLVRAVAADLRKPMLPIDVRPDLVIGEWALLLRRPVWAIVATAAFGEMLTRFFADVPGIENLHVLVHGRDDLASIPDDAPTYVTHRVRDALGDTPIRGRMLPPARTIATESAHAIFEFIVRANLAAAKAVESVRGDGDSASPRSS